MNIPIKILRQLKKSEEKEQWKAKKVFIARATHQKINEINLARKNSKPLQPINKIKQDNPFKAKLLREDKLMSNGYEVVIKITSNSKNMQQLTAHLKYISRQGTLELLDSEIQLKQGEEHLDYFLEQYQNGYVIPSESSNTREKRETYNMVFSMRDYDECDTDSLYKSAFKTIKSLYPNSYFTLALHKDTDNPHCHICLRATNTDGSRIHIQKADLLKMRKVFAKNLNSYGIEAYATRRTDKMRGYDIANKIATPNIRHENRSDKNYYKVLDFGKAPYNDDILNKPSFFISYMTKNGKATIWGNDLERLVTESNLQKGEYARIGKIGYTLQPYEFEKIIAGKEYIVQSAKKVALWDISIKDRAEKSFIKMPKPNFKPKLVLKSTLDSEISESSKPKNQGVQNEPRRYTKEQWIEFYARRKARFDKSKSAKYRHYTGEPREHTSLHQPNTIKAWTDIKGYEYLSKNKVDIRGLANGRDAHTPYIQAQSLDGRLVQKNISSTNSANVTQNNSESQRIARMLEKSRKVIENKKDIKRSDDLER